LTSFENEGENMRLHQLWEEKRDSMLVRKKQIALDYWSKFSANMSCSSYRFDRSRLYVGNCEDKKASICKVENYTGSGWILNRKGKSNYLDA